MFPRFSPNYSFRELFSAIVPAKRNAIEKLEASFSKRTNHKYAIAFRYGRSGLYYLLKALNLKDKKIIIPAYTCVVVAHAVVKSGNIPIFLDNYKDAFQPYPEDYYKAITKDTGMVIFTNLYGISEETAQVFKKIKAKYPSVFILQDCAHSFFCEDLSNTSVLDYGDGAIFGMNISKLVNSVRGGMLILKSQKIAKKTRQLANLTRNSILASVYCRIYVLASCFAFSRVFFKICYLLQYKTPLLRKFTTYYKEDSIELPKDFNFEIGDFAATIGLLSLDKYDARIAIRRKIAKIYISRLSNLPKKVILKLPEFKAGNTWSHFPVAVEVALKEKLIENLSSEYEIGRVVEYSIPDLQAYKLYNQDCPNSSIDAQTVINLPLTFHEGIFCINDYEKAAHIFIDKMLSITGG
jgi:dTDP-4-amino-4,6-dideoxygalactose transaminase